MNDNTIIGVHCYQGDAHQVIHAMPMFKHHDCQVVVLSPADSQVLLPGCDCRPAGKRAYIGSESWTRQHEHLQILLSYPHKYFLLNDSDSFCVSAKIPQRLYDEAEDTLWSNEVVEPRPHASPYPKIAAQPPYFLTRESIKKMLDASARVPVHPITPYIDYAMLAWACEAGLKHRAFTELEHEPRTEEDPESMTDPWKVLEYRIKFMGTVMQHPIKTPEQVRLCVEARKFYEANQS